MGSSVYLGVIHANHHKIAEFQRSPISGVLPYANIIEHRTTKFVMITYGERRACLEVIAFAQMRRAVCQRQLSFLFGVLWPVMHLVVTFFQNCYFFLSGINN